MLLEKLQSYAYGVELAGQGFWNSESEDVNARAQDYNVRRKISPAGTYRRTRYTIKFPNTP